MTSKRLIVTVDSHTQGEPTRLVIGGIIHYPGDSMREKQSNAARDLDWIRKSLMGEPRGHHDMYGGFITPPVTASGDLGVLYMDNSGFMDMCGHGTIGLCTSLVELGIISANAPRTEMKIDTPAGCVTGFAFCQNGKVERAGFYNVPAFCISSREQVEVEGLGAIEVGIAYGGNFFAIAPAATVGVEIDLHHMNSIREVGMRVKDAVNAQIEVRHPVMSEVSGVNLVTFYGPSENPDATYKNVHIFSAGQIDRSPGGTGSSAMLAYLMARGEMGEQDGVVVEGLAGGLFDARTVKSWKEGELLCHTTEISGRAYLTGVHTFSLDKEDPMVEGFLPL